MEKLNWKQKTDMLVNQSLISSKQIMLIFDLGQPLATEVKNIVKDLAKQRGRWIGEKKVPTDLVLEVMGLDYDYFKKMAINEKSIESALAKNDDEN